MEEWEFGSSRKEVLKTVAEYVKQNGMKTTFNNSVFGLNCIVAFRKKQQFKYKKTRILKARP